MFTPNVELKNKTILVTGAAVVMAIVGASVRTMFNNLLWEVATVLLCVFVYAVILLLISAGRKQLAELPFIRKILRLK